MDDEVGVQLLTVLREALSNVVRHSGASRVAVSVEVTAIGLVATVTDDGVGAGLGQRPGGNGLSSLRHRAETLGGTFELRPGDDGTGTAIRWQLPLGIDGP